MAATYDVTTPLGRVRLEIPDTDVEKAIFQDEELEVLLAAEDGNPLLAAAAAIEIIAGDPRRLQDYQRGSVRRTPQLAFNLRERAAGLRKRAAQAQGIVVGTIQRSDFWE